MRGARKRVFVCASTMGVFLAFAFATREGCGVCSRVLVGWEKSI